MQLSNPHKSHPRLAPSPPSGFEAHSKLRADPGCIPPHRGLCGHRSLEGKLFLEGYWCVGSTRALQDLGPDLPPHLKTPMLCHQLREQLPSPLLSPRHPLMPSHWQPGGGPPSHTPGCPSPASQFTDPWE